MLDKVKLSKLLAMTTSDTDPEALSAIRMANALLTREGVTWAEVLQDAPASLNIVLQRTPYKDETDEKWVAPHLKDAVIIDLMFRILYAQPRSGSEDFWRWVDDVHAKWKQYGSLTPGQYEALRRCYNRTKRAAS